MQANHRKMKYEVLTVHLQLPSNNKTTTKSYSWATNVKKKKTTRINLYL